ncbi:hypothetical protein HHI36_009573 [Cryptolaemus montrouzieri]|uniref:Attacin C-terminal domain-containing protein n=1 Tax=Cryptolaemus montrouzieri TaxID=559131 RepID=A0ABD2MG53_9CUCU
MMKIAFVIVATICAVSNAQIFDIVEDEFGGEFALVPLPLSRQRRQTTADINKGPSGTQVTLGHQGTIWDNGNHKVTGGGFASKQFRPTGPLTLGGNVGYEHIPSGSGVNLGASNTRGFGTDLSATGNANIWRNGNSRLDATGSYGRHFGGPGGTGRPNWGVGLNFNHRF